MGENGVATGPEVVLACPRKAFEAYCYGPNFRYRPLPADQYDAERFTDRLVSACRPAPKTPELEADESVKQAVVYAVLCSRVGWTPRFWVYRRPPGEGDARLDRRWSLGVGGHVRAGACSADEVGLRGYGSAVVYREARREVAEEVGVTRASVGVYGILNHEGDHVGRCHFGFLCSAFFPDPDSVRVNPGAGVEPVGWFTAAEVGRMVERGEPFEPWSVSAASVIHTWSFSSAAGYARVAP